jgi:hypothetical protein
VALQAMNSASQHALLEQQVALAFVLGVGRDFVMLAAPRV